MLISDGKGMATLALLSLRECCLWPRWGIHSSFMFRGQENSVGVAGVQRDYCLPDLQTFFFIYINIYKNATVLLWSIKDPLKICKWWSSLRGRKIVDVLYLRPSSS